MKRTFCKLVTKTHFRIIFNIQPLVSFFFLKVTPKSQKREGRERGCHVVPKSERREEGQANREVGIQSPSARTNYLTKVLRVGCFPPLIDKSLLSLASRGAGLRTSKPWLWLKGTPRRALLPSSSWAVEGGEKSGCYLAGGVTSPFSSFKIFCVLLHKWVLLLSFTFTPIGLSDSKNPCIGQFGIIVLKKKMATTSRDLTLDAHTLVMQMQRRQAHLLEVMLSIRPRSPGAQKSDRLQSDLHYTVKSTSESA